MDLTISRIVYALIFISVLLGVEGAYLSIRGNDRRQNAANQRMEAIKARNVETLAPSILKDTIVGGAISRLIGNMMPALQIWLRVAGFKATAGQWLMLNAASVLGVFVLMRLAPKIPTFVELLITVILGLGIPYVILSFSVNKQRKAFVEQLPDAINLITRGLQAGHPVPVAFGLVARDMPDPIGSEIGMAVDEINFGRDRALALRDISSRYPIPEFMFFISAIEMQKESGGNLVGILDNLVKVMRERSNLRKKAFAVSAEGRLTAVIVGSLPYLLGAYFLLTNRDFFLSEIDNPMFWPMMGIAWLMWFLGMVIIWRMVNIKV